MDALSDVLRVAHLTGGVFLHADFFAPWCMAARVAPEHCSPALGPVSHLILYHYVVEGEFRIRVEGEDGDDLIIGAGEVVLLPRNDLHLMGSDLSLPPVAGSDIIQPPKDGGLFSINHGGAGLLMAGTMRGEVVLAAANGLYLVLLLLGGMVIPLSKLLAHLLQAEHRLWRGRRAHAGQLAGAPSAVKIPCGVGLPLPIPATPTT